MNDYFEKIILKKLKIPNFLAKTFCKLFLNKMMICNGFIHSDFSDSVLMKLNQKNIEFQLIKNKDKDKIIKNTLKKLKFLDKYMGFKTMSLFLAIYPFGKSFHIGGSFPMNIKNNFNATDSLGRLKIFNNVHIIDSSIFSNIPPNTVTFTEMANAHRIGRRLL